MADPTGETIGAIPVDEWLRTRKDAPEPTAVEEAVWVPGWGAFATVRRFTTPQELMYLAKIGPGTVEAEEGKYNLPTLDGYRARKNRLRMIWALVWGVKAPIFTFEAAIRTFEAADSMDVVDPLFNAIQRLNPVVALELDNESIDPLFDAIRRDTQAGRFLKALARDKKLAEAFGPDNRSVVQPFLDNVDLITEVQLSAELDFANRIAAALAPRVAALLGVGSGN